MPHSCHDLHTHSTASDGTLTPAELVAHADAQGIKVLAVTDHDTTDGLAEARRVAYDRLIELVPGVEVSVTWNRRTIHVVGLQVDPGSRILREALVGLRAYREWRAEEIGRRLDKHGIPVAHQGARKLARGAIVTRAHFARYMVAHGYAKTVQQVFHRFMVRGKPGYVPGQWASLGDAIHWIRAAGGQAVLAHPGRYPLTGAKLRRLLEEFKAFGGVGIEVVSGSHSVEDCRIMAAHARSLGLLASAGSDYHGPEKARMDLGRLPALPQGCTPIWETWRR